MDELYFEEGYVTSKYFVYTANAVIGLEPYIASGYLPSDYFESAGSFSDLACDFDVVIGALIEAQSYQESSFTLSAQAFKTVDVFSNIQSTFTQSTIGTRGKDIDMFAFSNAAIAIQVDRIRQTNISVSSAFDIATDFVVTRSADADVDSILSAIINGLRSRDTITQTQAAFSFVVSGNTSKEFACQIQSSFATSVQATITRTVSSNIISAFTQEISGQRIRFVDALQAGNFTLTAVVRQIRDAHLTAFNTAALTVTAVKQVSAISSTASTFTQTFLGGKLQTYSAEFTAVSSIFVSRNLGIRPLNLVNGNVGSFVTNIKKFGTHSAFEYSRSTNAYRARKVIPTINEDFLIDGWIYFGVGNGGATLFQSNGWITINSLINRSLRFRAYYGPSSTQLFDVTSSILSQSTWHHFSIVKRDTYFSIYINGSRIYNIPNLDSAYLGGNDWAPYQNDGNVFFAVNAGTASNIDEFRFLKGTAGGYQAADAVISVPTVANINDPDVTQFLYHFDGNGFDDVTLTQVGSASLSSAFTQTSIIGGQFKSSANLSATSTLTAVIGELQDINLQAFTNASLTAIPVKTVTTNSSQSVQITTDAVATKTTDIVSNNNIAFTSTASAQRSRDNVINVSALASTVTVAVETQDFIINLGSSFSTDKTYFGSESGNYIDNGYYETRNIDAQKTVTVSSSLQSQFNLTVDAKANLVAELACPGFATLGVNAVKITDVVSAQNSLITSNVNAERFRDIISNQSSAFTVFVQGITNQDYAASLFNSVTLAANVDRIRGYDSDNNSEFTIVIETFDSLNVRGQADLDSEFTQSSSARKITDVSVSTQILASELAVVVKTVRPGIVCETISTMSVTAVKTTAAVSTLQSQITVVATATAIRRFIADISSAMSFAVAIRDLRLDEVEYRIPAENWIYTIEPESGIFIISSETRLRNILEETGFRTIEGETREYILE